MQSVGKDELRVFLGRDKRLLADLRLLLKTEKYTKQRTNSGATPRCRRSFSPSSCSTPTARRNSSSVSVRPSARRS